VANREEIPNPRDWIRLTADALEWLKDQPGVQLDKGSVRELISTITHPLSSISHRVRPGKDWDLSHGLPKGLAVVRVHPYLQHSDGNVEARIVVRRSWDEAEVNWQEGTVRGLREGERWPIEAYRLRLEEWAHHETARVRGRAKVAERLRAEGAIPSSSANTQNKKGSGGRTPKYNWTSAAIQIGAWLHAEGLPEKGDGGQAELERRTASLFQPDDCPAPSSIENLVRQSIETHRKELNEKPNKPKN